MLYKDCKEVIFWSGYRQHGAWTHRSRALGRAALDLSDQRICHRCAGNYALFGKSGSLTSHAQPPRLKPRLDISDAFQDATRPFIGSFFLSSLAGTHFGSIVLGLRWVSQHNKIVSSSKGEKRQRFAGNNSLLRGFFQVFFSGGGFAK